MRSRTFHTLLTVVALGLTSSTLAMAAANASADTPEGTQVIEVTAKKYEFNPSPIRVKQGTKVQLKITATDRTHGFKISEYADGVSPNGKPGLVFSSPQDCLKLEKDKTQTVEFVAQTPGTYHIRCCVHCGLHHRSMTTELIVEP
ncbi:MAG TPA: cupredoxin domain-containing protein [Candidatus Sulfotelmatobacter sp.]|nr:cupredoxin domain-containing protein [Candidatus Sulfotelmatobacter sp.]